MQNYPPIKQINNPTIHTYTLLSFICVKLSFSGSVMLIRVILPLCVSVLLHLRKSKRYIHMNKQKIKPLDEERESRSLLSNAVVILHLVFGTLPLLLVVWAVDRLMSDTLTSTAIWMVGAAMLLFALLRGVFYGTSIWRAHRSAYNALTRLRLRIVSHLQRLPLHHR